MEPPRPLLVAPASVGRVWRRILRAAIAAVGAMVLTSCQVAVDVEVAMNQNGSGAVTVSVAADQAVVEQAPGLADDLRLDDLIAAGWSVDGPAGTPDGGLKMVMTRSFDTPEQATDLLRTLNGAGGPFTDVTFERDTGATSIDYHLSGRAVADGLIAFADPGLLSAVGAVPYADALDTAGLQADEAVTLTLSVILPGVIGETTAAEDNVPLTWDIPIDGTVVDVTSRTRLSLASGRNWTALATLSFVALGLWVLLGVVAVILIARRQHQRRKRRRSLAALIALEARDEPY